LSRRAIEALRDFDDRPSRPLSIEVNDSLPLLAPAVDLTVADLVVTRRFEARSRH